MSRALALAAGLALTACQPSVVFDTDVKGSTTIDGNPFGGLLGAFPQVGGFSNINLSTSQEFTNQGVRKEDVRSVKVKSFVIQITSPDNQDFAWLSSLAFSLEAAGQPKARLAHKEAIESLGLKP